MPVSGFTLTLGNCLFQCEASGFSICFRPLIVRGVSLFVRRRRGPRARQAAGPTCSCVRRGCGGRRARGRVNRSRWKRCYERPDCIVPGQLADFPPGYARHFLLRRSGVCVVLTHLHLRREHRLRFDRAHERRVLRRESLSCCATRAAARSLAPMPRRSRRASVSGVPCEWSRRDSQLCCRAR